MFFEDVEEGRLYTSSLKKPITGTEIDTVCQMSGMDHPGFLNREVAKAWGFKDRVTPGAYLIACMFAMMKQDFLSNAVWMGSENISFKNPVFPNDVLSAECEALSKKEAKRGGGPVTYRWRIKNQEDTLVAEGTNT
jgi:acyl dehydratase